MLTDSWQEIVNDDEIQIVIEVMGGMEPARTYIMEAMQAGKQVVTANKDLIAADGKELMDQAKKADAICCLKQRLPVRSRSSDRSNSALPEII